MNRKRSILVFALAFLVVLALTIRIAHCPDPEGQWAYVSSRTVTYSVNQSSDDAMLTVGYDFASAGQMIPLRLPTYDTRFAFRIHVDDAVNNATHRELVYPGNAYFEVWSDDSTFAGSLSGTLSIYMTNETEVLTFANYTDLMNRPNHYFVGTTQISEFGRVGSSDPEWRDFTTNLLHNALNDMNLFPWTDNNTIAFIFQTTKGEQVYFWTFDEGHAPRLTVVWDLYEWVDVIEPSGYSNSTFIEEWIDGFYIWMYQADSAEGWINYGDYNFVNVSGGVLEIEDNVTLRGTQITGNNGDELRLVRSGSFVSGSVRMGINVTDVTDNSGPAHNSYVGFLFGHANANESVEDIDNNLRKATLFGVRTPDNATDDIFHFILTTHNAGVWNNKIGQDYNITRDPIFGLNYTWDYGSRNAYITIYNDTTFSTVLEYINRTGYVNIMTSYNWEFGFNTQSDPGGDGSHWSFNEESLYEDPTYVVADENGTVLGTFPTLQGARDFVGWSTSSANPAYDALPNLGNTVIAIMGIMGLVMIPGSFIMFGHSVKSGEWVQGFYYLLVMFFVGLGFVTVWLFG